MSTTPRKVVVTGASSGIGRAVAQRLLAQGWQVVGLARDHQKFVPPPGPTGSSAYTPVTLDLANLDALPAALRQVVAAHPDISAVVSNAGQPAMGALESFSPAQIREAMDINLVSHLLVAKAFVPVLKTAGGGDLVFMGSESALRGARRGALYCAAKFGLRGLAQALRPECANRGVRVTIINPGVVRTPFFDTLDFRPGPEAHHAIEPDDVAAAVYTALSARPGTVIDEINLSPLQHVLDFGPVKGGEGEGP